MKTTVSLVVVILLLGISNAAPVEDDPCLSLNPCKNGGTCYGDLFTNTTQCLCATGFAGHNCVTNCSSPNLNLQTDFFNCGTCGHVCAVALACCGGSCVSVASNNTRCGNCTHQCSSSQVCRFSHCVTPFRATNPNSCTSHDQPICVTAQQCLKDVFDFGSIEIGDHPHDALVALSEILDLYGQSLAPVLSYLHDGNQQHEHLANELYIEIQSDTSRLNNINDFFNKFKAVISSVLNTPLETASYDLVESWGNQIDDLHGVLTSHIPQNAESIATFATENWDIATWNSLVDVYRFHGINFENVLHTINDRIEFVVSTASTISDIDLAFWARVLACPIACCNNKQCVAPSHTCAPTNAFKAHVNYESTLINHCASTPCKNNGTCYSSSLSFDCDCSKTNYKGRYCDVSKQGSQGEYITLMFLSIGAGLFVLGGFMYAFYLYSQ